jgi:hypothetical protein
MFKIGMSLLSEPPIVEGAYTGNKWEYPAEGRQWPGDRLNVKSNHVRFALLGCNVCWTGQGHSSWRFGKGVVAMGRAQKDGRREESYSKIRLTPDGVAQKWTRGQPANRNITQPSRSESLVSRLAQQNKAHSSPFQILFILVSCSFRLRAFIVVSVRPPLQKHTSPSGR